MAILSKGTTFSDGDQLTSDSLNNLVDNSTFASGAVDDSTTQLSSGKIIVKDLGVSTGKIAASAVTTAKINASAVTTAKIADSNVTKAKIENLADYKVLGNVSGGAAAPAEVAILDEDNMSSNSATSLATQQSIKAYVDTQLTAEDLDFAGDSGTGSVDLDGQTFTIAGSSGLDTSASSQTLTIALDFNEISNAAIADGDFIPFVDATDSTTKKEAIADIATLFAGTGLSASSSVLSVDASQTQITSVGTLGAGAISSGFGAIDNGSSAITTTGVGSFGSLDISGNVDVDGTLETDALSIASTAVTATAAELNILDGVTSTTAELNILDGVTSTASEINLLDGSTANTVVNSKAVVYGSGGQVAVTSLSGVLANGVTATTQSASDNSTKVATTAYVDAQVGTSDTLAEVLANGNTTGSTNIVVSNGQSITTNTIAETTSGSGVTIDGVLIKDNAITASGEIDGGSLDISGDADIDGTLEADAITVNGTALATVIAGTTVTNATNSAHVSVADNESTDEENLITFIEDASATGNVGLESDGDFSYNPSTGTVSATIFKGNIDAVDGDFDGTLETDALSIGGTTVTSTAAELNYLDISTLGTSEASKAVTVDANGDLLVPDSDKFKFGTGSDMQVYHDGTNSYITNSTGELKLATENSGTAIAIGHSTSEATFGDNVTITGNLTVNGTTTTVNTTNLTVTDPLVKFGEGYTGTAYDEGFIVTRGDGSSSNTANKGFIWDETADEFAAIACNTEDGTTAGNVTINSYADLQVGKLTGGSLDISGDIDVDGTTNLDVVDIDGAVQIDSTLTVGVDDTGHDVKFFGATSGSYMQWNESADDLILGGAAKLGIGTTSPNGKIEINGGGTSTSGGTLIVRQDGDTNADGIALTSSHATSHRIWKDSNGKLNIGSSSAPSSLVQDLTGNVGIGTTSPGNKLSVSEASTDFAALITNSTSSGNGLKINAGDNSGDRVLELNDKDGNSRMQVSALGSLSLTTNGSTNSSSAIVINSSGDNFESDGGMIRLLHPSDGSGALTGGFFMKFNANSSDKFTVKGNGDTAIAGALSKGSGSFKIPHPLESKKDTHNLVHSFLEGPQADLIYRGRVDLVDGVASVNIDVASDMTDGTFVVLCRDIQSFTTNESGWTAVRSSVDGNILTIEAQDNTCTDSISWMVVGERQDEHMYETEWTDEDGKVIVEPLAPEPEPEPEEEELEEEITEEE